MTNFNQENKNIIVNSLRLIRKCPSCNTKYTQNEVKVIEVNQDEALVYFSCSKCLNAMIANLINMPFGMAGSAMLTDLQPDEVLKFKKGGGVTVDDVLEVYKELEVNRNSEIVK